MNSMIRLEFGPLQGVRVEIGPNREPSLRAALARLLDCLDRSDRDAANSLLNHEVTYHGKPCALGAVLSSSIDRLAYDVISSTMGGEILDTISREARDAAIRKATVKLGATDRAESEALSEGGRVVFAWASGEVLAFAEVGDRFRDVTDEVLDELDAEPDPAPPGDYPPAVDLAEDLEAALEGRPLAPVAVAEAPPAARGETIPAAATMCSLCAGDIAPGEARDMWPTDSQHPAHMRCQQAEIARRSARGLYGTAEEMRRELAMRGRPVGEVWEVRELERRVLDSRRETDEIDWSSYETKTAVRKQGRPCLVCGSAITKSQDYKQASRGRKAHRACVVQEEAQRERAAIQAEQPDVQPA